MRAREGLTLRGSVFSPAEERGPNESRRSGCFPARESKKVRGVREKGKGGGIRGRASGYARKNPHIDSIRTKKKEEENTDFGRDLCR